MTAAVTPRASNPSNPSGEPTTLHETMLQIAEHLKDTGDFNDRAYVALCNVAREAHSMRDDTITLLQAQIEIYRSRLEALQS
jgi:hypothetical protein